MPNQVITRSNLLTTKEAANFLQISETQLREFANKGLISKVKDRVNLSKTYYLKSDLENFLDTRYFIVEDK